MNAQTPQLFPELTSTVPAFAEAIHRHENGDLAGARVLYTNLIDQPQMTAPCLHQLGLIAAAQGEHARAADLFIRVTRLEPTLWVGYANLCAAFDRIGKAPEATAVLIDFACNLYRLHQYKEAEPVFRQVLAREPAGYVANANLGTCMAWLNNLDEAAALLIRAIRVYGRVAPEMATFVTELERHIDKDFLARIAPLPDGPVPNRTERVEDALTSLGKVLCDMGFEQAALLCHRMAATTAPGFALAHWNLALALLTRGDYQKGWAEYEWRWEWPEFPEPRRRLPAAPWRGEPLTGKRILVWGEQGFGDVMQFVPLVQHLAETAGEVLLEVQQPLQRLLAGSLTGVEVICHSGQPNAVATDKLLDYAVPLMSLQHRTRLVRESLPITINYLRADPADAPLWQNRMQTERPLRIGLVWATRPYPDTRRAIPLRQLRPLFERTMVAWYSLQVGPQQQELSEEAIPGLTDLSPHIIDFADTAAAISQLDLVITVDTAVAHLAGAMGKPVWTLLRDVADWRWGHDRSITPWYPSMRLFRQTKGGNWDEVIRRVCKALDDVVESCAEGMS
ncbi:MAG: tetratricopeptide repeat protein [Rhizomicrobium sp.]